ncbi:MAG: diheme cytochrome c-553 [Cyclobacteriaceae bacterium]|nr:diheme cytochrome c-553 [Cyclobacteriaceae bacterium]
MHYTKRAVDTVNTDRIRMNDVKPLMQVNRLLVTAILAFVLVVIMAITLISCYETSKPTTLPVLGQEELITRGEYLVNTSACHDCHSPKIMTPNGPEPDPKRLLSGYPKDMPLPKINKEALKDWVLFNQHLTSAVGPWGVSFAANITSDEMGIGNWTEEQFLTALKKGKYKGLEGSRSLLPPMPWPIYRNMSDEDIMAIFAYLKTTQPVRNIVPAPIAPDQIQ